MATKAKQLTIGSLLTTLIGGGGLYGIDEYLEWKIANKKGGFRTALSEEINVKPELIPNAFGKMYHWMDSVQKFQKETMPLIRKIKNEIDVGIKVNKNNGRMMYLHTNGHPYRAFKDSASGAYFFINDDDVVEYCK